MTKIELIDELAGDIIAALFPKLNEDSDAHDKKYSVVHAILRDTLKGGKRQ